MKFMARNPYSGVSIRLMPVVALALVGSSSGAIAQPNINETNLKHTPVLEGLEEPWDMAFLDDGTMFFTEKCKGLSVRLSSGDVKPLLGMGGSNGYATVADDLFCEGQGGMMGVAIDPKFADNRRIYVYASSKKSNPHTNRLMRLVVADDLTGVSERVDIVDDIPFKMKATDHPFGDPGAHNGGRVRFHPESGFLYLTTGDNHNEKIPQSPTLMGSKVLRIDTDGNAAPGNQPPKGFDSRTFTYGHRNVQGLAFHKASGKAVVAEHGPWHSDEITVLANGGNGGWDPRENMAGRGECPDDYCGYMPNQQKDMNRFERASFMPMTDFETYPDAMPPIWRNNGWSQGTSSIAFLKGKEWKEWEGALAVGIMGIGFGSTPVGQRIDVLRLDDNLQVTNTTKMNLPMKSGRFRSLVVGPKGNLYVAVSEGIIHKLTPGG